MKRVWRWPVYLAISALLVYVLHVPSHGLSIIPNLRFRSPVDSSLLQAQQHFWARLYHQILAAEPRCPPIPHVGGWDLMVSYDASNHEAQRPDRLDITDAQVTELTSTHNAFKAHLEDAHYELPLINGTRGIATTAGGDLLPVAVVSIQMLRQTGCTLPIEVFLGTDDEWDPQICDVALPRLSARCIVLDHIFNPFPSFSARVSIEKYQFKILATVFSSFEEVLFLDSDCFPTSDPTGLFDWEQFQSAGMIRWPDFWFGSESPHFFNMAGLATPRIQHRSSTESGELMYSKPKHSKSLLLALYYNFYGPDFYYPLQAQGGPGEGDKETFHWSQVVFGDDFYSVQQKIQALGYLTTKGDWRGSAMVQFDPRNDATHAELGSKAYDKDGMSSLPPMFVHANFPKLNPGRIFQDESGGATGPTRDSDGRLRRIWIEDETRAIKFFGYDVERRVWSVIRDVACEFQDKFAAWKGQKDICTNATVYWDTVFGRSVHE